MEKHGSKKFQVVGLAGAKGRAVTGPWAVSEQQGSGKKESIDPQPKGFL